jgi:hypothetical protein
MPHYKDTNNQLHFLDSAEFAYLLPADCVEITDAEAESIQAARAAAQAAAQAPVILKADAQAALDKSDVVLLRCFEHAVALPAAWQTYRTALRAIVNGSDTTSTTLPTIPAYPV